MWPVLFLLPALVLAAILLWAPKEPAGQFEFANAFPIPILEALFFTVSGLVAVAFAISIRRFLAAMRQPGSGGVTQGLVPALRIIASHERFAQCADNRSRYWGHLLVLWGFAGLALVGTIIGIGTMVNVIRTPLDLLHPAKIFANVCAVVILAGLAFLFVDRVGNSRNRAASTYFDWFFLLTLGGVVATGVLSEVLRLSEATAMFPVYFVHLVLVLTLFLYAPYSKFAHLAYRTIAIAAVKAAEKRPRQAEMAVPASRGAG
jgi:quinone-modifying oxidoreductase subunit QmoC